MHALFIAFLLALVEARARHFPGFRTASNAFLRRFQREEADGPPAQWFPQRTDHFDYQNDGVWSQRYYVNASYYKPRSNAPVFFVIGGEGAISNGYVTRFECVEYAKTLGALVVALEHRFYGLSQPTGNLSLDSLRTLNSRQALADAAYFITSFLNQPAYIGHGPVISFGGSYPGALSAWFRMKYPHIVKAAVASSAPVHAVLDMVTYLTDVDEALVTLMGKPCLDAYRAAFNTASRLARTTSGAQTLSTQFNTCTPLPVVTSSGVPRDVAGFFSNVIGLTMGTVQYNLEQEGATTVAELCAVMTNQSISAVPYDRLVAQWNQYGADGDCMDIAYADAVAQLRNITVGQDGGVGIRQWTYQTCTEFGYFQTTDAPASQQPFGNLMPLQFSLDLCADAFGPGSSEGAPVRTSLLAFSAHDADAVRDLSAGSVDAASWPGTPTSPSFPRIGETNALYGSKHPRGATQILYVNGGIDPWHTLSVVQNQTESLIALVIRGAAHCANMDPYVEGVTPPAVRAAQAVIQNIVSWFVASPYQ